MKIRLSRRAERDLSAIADYVGALNPRAAASIGRAIRASLELIGLHPRVGRPQQDSDLLKLVVPRYGYLIYYRILPQLAIVATVTIRHPSRARPTSDA